MTIAKSGASLVIVCAAAGMAMSGCKAGARWSRSKAEPKVVPAETTFNPYAISSAGLVANRPIEVTNESPTASGSAAKSGPSTSPGTNTKAAGNGNTVQAQAMAAATAGQIDADRGGTASLAQISFSPVGADFDPDVARDGSLIVFASTQHSTASDIYLKSTEGRVVTQLTTDPGNDVMPKLSPDGTRVAFASNRSGNWDIFVIPINGGRAIQITTDNADEIHPSWSPDGTQLVFSRMGQVSGQWEMWTTSVGNAGVARFLGYGLFPEWCPVSGTGLGGADRIVYQKSRNRGDRAFGVWAVDYSNGQAGTPTEIAAQPEAACINPSWSPDGQWIAFAAIPNATAWSKAADARPGTGELWLVDINGYTRVNLSAGNSLNLMPAWGSESRLFFVSDRGGVDNIWSMDIGPVLRLASLNMSSIASPRHAEHRKDVAAPVAGAGEPQDH
ncbi:MAG: DPP IV N-terminal domain-containing protein [Phycisphaerales bacterium]